MLTTAQVDEIRNRARRDAAATLEVYWPGGTPVDPVVIARKLGIEVFRSAIDGDTYGMLVWNGGGASMYLEKDQAANRFRFTCAHEIGHYVERTNNLSSESDVRAAYVDRRSDEGRGDPAEVYANEFAASLLMPPHEVRDMARAGASDFEMASYFAVSLDALRYRRKLIGV